MATDADLDSVLVVVRDHRSGTAKGISYLARNADGSPMDPGKVTRLLRELERRGLVRPWKRPGTRALLWSPVDA